MSPHEIETKWDATKIPRAKFNRFVWSVIDEEKHLEWTFKSAGGYDHYFVNSLGFVARHRDGDDLKELTVKARLDDNDITVRIEHNVALDPKHATIQSVHGFLKTSGYQKRVSIHKDCDIYRFKTKNSPVEATVVWYEVTCPEHPPRTFIEVEVDGGSKKQRLKVLKQWTRALEKGLKIGKKQVSQESLYEIYTGLKYRLI